MAAKKKMTEAQDRAMDRKRGIKEGSRRDVAADRKAGVPDKGAKRGKRK